MNSNKDIIKRFPLKRISMHILFWGISYYVLISLFSSSSSIQKIDHIYTSIFLITVIIPSYLSIYLIIPRWLDKNRLTFAFLTILNIIFFSGFNFLLFSKLIDYLLPNYYFISYYSFFDLLKFFVVFVVLTGLVKLSKDWFILNERNKKITALEKEKLEAELKFLMNQVNPHFLFNSLTVLYSLAIENSNKTADAIIKLSDILRYVIYESNNNTVTLESEIKLLENYIHLQKFRIPKESSISFKSNINDYKTNIAPMLLLPLIENSFKHGIKGDIDNTFITINLKHSNGFLDFEIANNKGESVELNDLNNSGIGLSNIKKRLSLIYPDRHTFKVEENDSYFKVNMKIEL